MRAKKIIPSYQIGQSKNFTRQHGFEKNCKIFQIHADSYGTYFLTFSKQQTPCKTPKITRNSQYKYIILSRLFIF